MPPKHASSSMGRDATRRASLASKAGMAFSSNRLALGGQRTALVVVEAGPLAQLLMEDSDLLLKIFDYEFGGFAASAAW
jgi:hypothetical protein